MLAVVMANVGNHRGMGLEYAHRLRSDIFKHLSVPHKVYCYTDQPASLYPRTRCKPHPVGVPWDLGRMFRAGAFEEDRILYLSLDTILTGDIDALSEYEGELAASAHGHVALWRNGFTDVEKAQPEMIEDLFPGLVSPYVPYPSQEARIITFDTAPHEIGGWVAEYWEREAA